LSGAGVLSRTMLGELSDKTNRVQGGFNMLHTRQDPLFVQ
jgi:hypothetical protein